MKTVDKVHTKLLLVSAGISHVRAWAMPKSNARLLSPTDEQINRKFEFT